MRLDTFSVILIIVNLVVIYFVLKILWFFVRMIFESIGDFFTGNWGKSPRLPGEPEPPQQPYGPQYSSRDRSPDNRPGMQ